MKQPSFNSKQIMSLARVSKINLSHWIKEGIVTPGIDKGAGRGKVRRWSFTDLIGLRVISMLRREGISLQRVRKILPAIRKYTGHKNNLRALAQSRLVLTNNNQVLLVAEDNVMDGLTDQILLALIPIKSVIGEVETAMLENEKTDNTMTDKIETLKDNLIWSLAA